MLNRSGVLGIARVTPFYAQVSISSVPGLRIPSLEWTDEAFNRGFVANDFSVWVSTIADTDTKEDDLAEVEVVLNTRKRVSIPAGYRLICEQTFTLENDALTVGDVTSDDYETFLLPRTRNGRHHLAIYGRYAYEDNSERPDSLFIAVRKN